MPGKPGIYRKWQRLFKAEDRSGLFRGVSVCVPAAPLQGEGAIGENFFRLFAALGAGDRLGVDTDDFFSNFTTLALKFINGHGKPLQIGSSGRAAPDRTGIFYNSLP